MEELHELQFSLKCDFFMPVGRCRKILKLKHSYRIPITIGLSKLNKRMGLWPLPQMPFFEKGESSANQTESMKKVTISAVDDVSATAEHSQF